MSVVTYTANDRAALISDHVAGDFYSFDITFMRFEKSYNSPKKQHQSIGGSVETVLARTDELISVEIGPYDSSDIPQIEEFIKSVSSGEQFQLDVHGTAAVASSPITVRMSNNKNSPTRHGPRTYSLAFNVLANAASSSTGGSVPLPPVEEVEYPVVAGWYSGAAGCAVAVAPTWSSGSLFVRENTSTGMSVFINQFIADNGGSPLASYAIAPGYALPGLPSTFAFNTSTSELTGDANNIAVGDYPVAFTATNDAGLVSGISPLFAIRIYDPAIEVVSITGVDAVAGTNEVFVNISTASYTQAGTAASYKAGFSLYVSDPYELNPVTLTYQQGGGSNRFKFTADRIFVANIDTLVLNFSNASSDLRSVSNDTQVSDSSVSYVVQPQPTQGVIFADSFESGNFDHVDPNTGANWAGRNRTSITNNARSGQYGLALTFPPASDVNGVSAEAKIDIAFGSGGEYNTNFYKDLWIKCDMHIPANFEVYKNQLRPDYASKGLIWIWGGPYSGDKTGPFITGILWPNSSGGVYFDFAASANVPGTKAYRKLYDKDGGKVSPLFSISDRNKWFELIIHVKEATWADLSSAVNNDWNGDGVFEMWLTREDSAVRKKVIDIQDGHWINTDTVGWTTGKGWNYLRVLGWAGAGYQEETVFGFDNFVVSTESLL